MQTRLTNKLLFEHFIYSLSAANCCPRNFTETLQVASRRRCNKNVARCCCRQRIHRLRRVRGSNERVHAIRRRRPAQTGVLDDGQGRLR